MQVSTKPIPKLTVLFLIALLVFQLILLALTTKQNGKLTQQPGTPLSVRLKWVNQSQFAGLDVAKAKGLYEDDGLDVTLLEIKQDASFAPDEVASGGVNFGIVSIGDFIKAMDRGLPVKALGVTFQNTPVVILSKKSNPVRSAGDLAGKKVGVSLSDPDSTKILFQTLLRRSGVTESKMTYVPIGFLRPTNVSTGVVDVTTMFRTDAYVLGGSANEYILLYPENFGVSLYDDVLITSDAFLASHRDVVKKFVSDTRKGWEYSFQHPEEAVSIVASVANSQYKDPAFLRYILDQDKSLIVPNGGDPIGNMTYFRWKQAFDAFYFSGVASKNLRPETFYINETDL
ncbi:MAG TPA: ABC transporter substrate-binding protein [Patescibacteria group bacterium]|nr:ABC transporter substrate-binding protein [Patescibacteria group bacterium]